MKTTKVSDDKKKQKSLQTEHPLSEKDEVKQAEQNTVKANAAKKKL
ncbi:hypothetical protein MUY27_18975 [Mucilaginibacter sp. RS28]|uniref:Uncharacterized protein n=1 Tax=Mucilaginibacter straminoryzae TaxID=2932774 RepID=A0A9X1X7X2_9SPHI|nr:hypothetical protein [Mucilaginibacter straminoryzae]MCJ8211810.1 hypothetical protein [Mucilaginibacter straminoryzae]